MLTVSKLKAAVKSASVGSKIVVASNVVGYSALPDPLRAEVRRLQKLKLIDVFHQREQKPADMVMGRGTFNIIAVRKSGFADDI